MNKFKDHDTRAELRDIFAAAAMISLIVKDHTPSGAPDWVALQAYKQADAMLDERDQVSHNEDNNK